MPTQIVDLGNLAAQALGLDAEKLTVWHMTLRAIVVYVVGIVLVRLGEKRFLGKNTAFDVLLAIILGSVVSRAVTGSSEFVPTLAAGFVLVGMHWLLAAVAFRSDRFGTLIKGRERTLIRDGEIQWDEMRGAHISKDDLLGALRTSAKVSDPGNVAAARLERSGDISVIPRDGQPKVVEVSVAEGVQTVRVEISGG